MVSDQHMMILCGAIIADDKIGFKDKFFTDRIWLPFEGVWMCQYQEI